jgi:hypothetical protein
MTGPDAPIEVGRLVPGFIVAKLENRTEDQARILHEMLTFDLPPEDLAIVVAGVSTSIIQGICHKLDVDPVEAVRHGALAAASFDPDDETDDDID